MGRMNFCFLSCSCVWWLWSCTVVYRDTKPALPHRLRHMFSLHTLICLSQVFDIQLLMGTGAVSISPDEYVFASLSLYLVGEIVRW